MTLLFYINQKLQSIKTKARQLSRPSWVLHQPKITEYQNDNGCAICQYCVLHQPKITEYQNNAFNAFSFYAVLHQPKITEYQNYPCTLKTQSRVLHQPKITEYQNLNDERIGIFGSDKTFLCNL